MPKSYTVVNDYHNSRLDRWFKQNVINLPHSLIEKLIRQNKVKVNKKKTKTSYRVQSGDLIEIFDILKFKPIDKEKKIKYIPKKSEVGKYDDYVIEDNENFIIINKPSGIAVQAGTKSFKNIIDTIKNTKYFENSKPYIVHRIDKETSGILIIAKNRKYAQLFTSLFRIRKIHKTYLGIVLGEMIKKKGTLIDHLYHYEGDKKIKSKAITHYSVINSNNNYSLLKLNPETGRKHQLRKQLLIHGNPILGDSKYRLSENKPNKKEALMLHAHKINFSIAGTKYNYLAEPPLIFKSMLKEKYLKNF